MLSTSRDNLASAAYQICVLRSRLCRLPGITWRPQPTSYRNVAGQKQGGVEVGRFLNDFRFLFPSNYGFMLFTGPRKGARGRFLSNFRFLFPFYLFLTPSFSRKREQKSKKQVRNAHETGKEAGKRLFSCLRREQILKNLRKTPKRSSNRLPAKRPGPPRRPFARDKPASRDDLAPRNPSNQIFTTARAGCRNSYPAGSFSRGRIRCCSDRPGGTALRTSWARCPRRY